MSIIYDALQKSQPSQHDAGQSEDSYSSRTTRVILTEVIVILVLSVIWTAQTFIAQKNFSDRRQHNAVLKKVAHLAAKNSIKLNGIFLSDGKNLAMINNALVEVGDQVAGFRIMSIGPDLVVLHDGQEMLELKS